jgi:hypothetical protein
MALLEPPLITSRPPPIIALPVSPKRTSLPAPPKTMSLQARSRIASLPGVPLRASFLLVPVMMRLRPRILPLPGGVLSGGGAYRYCHLLPVACYRYFLPVE